MCEVPLVMPSMREAVLVVSPITVYSSRRSEPTLPAMTSPELRPTPTRKPSPRPSERIHSLNSSSAGAGHLARRRVGAVGVVLELDRRAEHGHDPVAHEGHERPAVLEDHVGHAREVAVEHLDHLVGRPALGEGREAADVAEQHGHHALLAAEPQVVVHVLHHLVHHRLGHEAREQVAHALALEGADTNATARPLTTLSASDGLRVDEVDDQPGVEHDLHEDEVQGRQQRADQGRTHRAEADRDDRRRRRRTAGSARPSPTRAPP